MRGEYYLADDLVGLPVRVSHGHGEHRVSLIWLVKARGHGDIRVLHQKIHPEANVLIQLYPVTILSFNMPLTCPWLAPTQRLS